MVITQNLNIRKMHIQEPYLQKMASTKTHVCLHIPGLDLLLYVETVILLPQELVMVQFVCGKLKGKAKAFGHCLSYLW